MLHPVLLWYLYLLVKTTNDKRKCRKKESEKRKKKHQKHKSYTEVNNYKN